MKDNHLTRKFRDFGLLIGVLFPLLIGFIVPKLLDHNFRIWTLYVGIPLIIMGIFSPSKLKKPYYLWINLGNTLGFINSHIIIGIIFYLILLPISILLKLKGYDPLRKKRNNLPSYRELRENKKINLEKLF
tara:strand:- start:59 stop:451 length:393 start_codon:yes stop_codon:yes gene_type:complete